MSPQTESYDDPVSTLRARTPPYLPFWRQREFEGWVEEQMSWKETCYIGDWSFLEDLRVRGPDALQLFSDISVNSFDQFPVGHGKHMIQCNDDGHVITEGVLVRRSDDEYAAYGFSAWWSLYSLQNGDYDVSAELVDTFNYQVQGPNSLQVLESVADGSLRDVGFMDLETIRIGGRELYPLRMGMAGEVGFELQGPAEYADEVWDAVVDAGQEYGIKRLGARTAMINHLEACFPTIGTDYLPAIFDASKGAFREWLVGQGAEARLTYNGIAGSFEADEITAWYRNPVELGWGNRITFDRDYPGRDALEPMVDDPDRTIVTLEWDWDDVCDVFRSLGRSETPYHPMDMPYKNFWTMRADNVLKDDEAVGVATSRGYSYYFRKMLSLCTIDVEHSEPGVEVTVVWGDPDERQKEIAATVAPAPYKEDKRRTDLSTLPAGS